MALQFQSKLSFSGYFPVSKLSTLRAPLSNPHTVSPRPPSPRRRILGLKISLKEGRDSKRIRICCNAKFEAGSEKVSTLRGQSLDCKYAISNGVGVDSQESLGVVKEKSVSVVLLAGGKGTRMGVNMPKQYLPLLGQPIALYSFYTFSQLSEVKEIVVVCDPSYKDVFEDASEEIQVDLKFAFPGKERQDSVFNGLQEIDGSSELVCIHDSARPLVSSGDIQKVLKDGWLNGAAVLGVHVKATIKEGNSSSFVVKTLDRRTLWEMQTPQVMKPKLLRDGFEFVNRNHLEVTDDVSIVEYLKHPVYITEGSYTNIKVTTPDDLLLAEQILDMKVPIHA